MKTNLFAFTLFLVTAIINAQENTIIENGNYYLDPVRSWNNLNINDNDANKLITESILGKLKGRSYILKVKDVIDNKVYFKFWKFTGKKELQKTLNGESNDKIYSISVQEFNNLTSIYYDQAEWSVGAFTVPFKLRFDDFSFDANVNLGTSLSAKIRFDRFKEDGFMIEPLVAFSATGVNLDDANTDNPNFDPATDTTNLLAFSVNGGLLFHINNKVNAGLFLGMDKLANSDQEKVGWKHDGNLWMGIGFNINFSDENNNTGPASN